MPASKSGSTNFNVDVVFSEHFARLETTAQAALRTHPLSADGGIWDAGAWSVWKLLGSFPWISSRKVIEMRNQCSMLLTVLFLFTLFSPAVSADESISEALQPNAAGSDSGVFFSMADTQIFAADSEGFGSENSCFMELDCHDGTSISCSSASSTNCEATPSSCPGQAGSVTCDGVTTHCSPCQTAEDPCTTSNFYWLCHPDKCYDGRQCASRCSLLTHECCAVLECIEPTDFCVM